MFALAPGPLVLPEKRAVLSQRPGLMASLDALNERFGRSTVRVATTVPAPGHYGVAGSGARAPWEGKVQWRSLAFTTRLEDLLMVN